MLRAVDWRVPDVRRFRHRDSFDWFAYRPVASADDHMGNGNRDGQWPERLHSSDLHKHQGNTMTAPQSSYETQPPESPVSRHFWVGLAVIAAVLFGCAFFAGCAGAPRSLEQLESMGQSSYDRWLVRVGAWAELATSTYVAEGGEPENAITLASVVRGASGEALDLAALFEQAGLDAPLALVIALEAQALIDARGGWPTGERLRSLLDTIAHGIESGTTATP